MQVNEALQHLIDRIDEVVRATAEDLQPAALTWRPDPEGNTIGWLLWHLTRVQDDHIAAIAGRDQIWESAAWASRFGLPADAMDTGYGHSSAEVAAIDPGDPQVLVEYHEQVTAATKRYLADGAPELDRVIDESYDPPVTVGVRLLSVTIDSLQHAGQSAYLRGMWERTQG